MKNFVFLFLALVMKGVVLTAQQDALKQLDIRFQPDSLVYVFENMGPEMSKSLYSAIVQNMAFVNLSTSDMVIEKVVIDAIKNDEVLQTKNVSDYKLKLSASKYYSLQERGYLDLYDFQLQTSQYLKGLSLASSNTIKPGEALILTHETFLFDGLPEYLEVSVTSRLADGVQIQAKRHLKVVNHKSKNSYLLPLKGTWTVAAGPSLIGHHRWGSIQEFAYDFIKIGENQKSHFGNGLQLEDYFAYGQSVFAVEDGVVVSVLDGIKESADNIKRPEKSDEEYMKRTMSYQNELLSKGFEYVFGNHVIIRHANNEYSNYLHLKNGSILVKMGENIKKGQVIGQLGHSGNSTEPHLHFHISNGLDIMHSRSIPVEFENITLYPTDNGLIRHIHSGQILSSIKE